jgi:L-threonylcarbamoyladenylate synthase
VVSGTIHCVSERFDFTGDELVPAYRAALDAKGRGRDMPPPVLISVVESLDALATDVPEVGRKLCEAFWPGPLTVICHAQGSLMWDLGETHGTVALRVPDHENTRELLSRTGPLAVSSANKSGQAAALDVYDAEAQLADSVAVYLDGGEVTGGQPSTIVDLTGDVPHVVRIGALSMAQIREVVPEATTDLEPDVPVQEQVVAEEEKPDENVVAEQPAQDEPTDQVAAASNEEQPAEKPIEDVAAEETMVDGKTPDARPAD